jgi:S-adenosylmethionine-diacylglycerol 3-amino-3-carboxypropyl transferase
MQLAGLKKYAESTHDRIFGLVHNRRLIYNTCWEDPRIDRRLLKLDRNSRVVMITSAGCNALDYLLDDPAQIHAVDVNYRQNALLQLKTALFQHGDYADLNNMFGCGCHPDPRGVYQTLNGRLPAEAAAFWGEKIDYFKKRRIKGSFYYQSAAGDVAWLFKHYLVQKKRWVRKRVFELFEAETLEDQRRIFAEIESKLWDPFAAWLVKHPLVMSMMGVPRPQIRLVTEQYPGGVPGFVQDKLKHVLTEIPLRDNYFWRVYLTGAYTEYCRPNYLKPENFEPLKARVGRIQTHTDTITGFLEKNPGAYTHFILLDHQDWLARHDPAGLSAEWRRIIQNSAPGAKILMRSAGLTLDFLTGIVDGKVRFFPEETTPLHAMDRVGTYGSLHLGVVI